MLKRITTFLLIGLFFFGTVGGSYSVLCFGSDGHIALEPAGHQHCDGDRHEKEAGDPVQGITIASDVHGACVDVMVGGNALITLKKNVRFSADEVFKAGLLSPSFSFQNTSVLTSGTADSVSLPSYFTPLGTIILLV